MRITVQPEALDPGRPRRLLPAGAPKQAPLEGSCSPDSRAPAFLWRPPSQRVVNETGLESGPAPVLPTSWTAYQ